ncbi:type III secretion protein HrpB4 [Trinickia dinghuensis]|uniref:Type III secretion protein n=1 Tax=Trinickia dinghuensis TaxID=2291023 RepID=A0A3D8K4S2_9BURK|nr:type III secretion protein HrpB4 [Trinickia dinghuensis]RDV00434.1 hypothetical protein DWV00_01185 [Trinickia dinghuensis]
MSQTDHPLIRMLRGFEARVLGLATALADSSRAPDEESRVPLHEQARAPRSRASAIKVAAARRIWFSTPVPLDAFLQPGNRLAILAPEELRSVLAARALLGCQDSIRRCIDRGRRRALALALGEQALLRLQAQLAARALGEPLPDDLCADALARRGWAMIADDGACRNATLGNIVDLSLALAAGGEAWQRMRSARADEARTGDEPSLDARRPAGSGGEAGDTSRFFSMAGDLFPEFQWLFG